MLNVRSEQIEELSRASESAFELRLIQLLGESFPEMLRVPHLELQRSVHALTDRARIYGLTTEQDFGIYVMVAWILGADFDTRFEAAKEVLTSGGYTTDDKRQWLLMWIHEMFAYVARQFGAGDELRPLPE